MSTISTAKAPPWVTVIETVPQALKSLARMFTQALESLVPTWLNPARDLWSGSLPDIAATAAVPV